MPLITLIGLALVLLGSLCISFTPKERIVQSSCSHSYGVNVAVINDNDTMISSMSVPFWSFGKVLEWQPDRQIYKWVPAPALDQNPK